MVKRVVILICVIAFSTPALAQRVNFTDEVRQLLNDANLLISEGKAARGRGNTNEAKEKFIAALRPLKEALKKDPNNAEVLVTAGLCYFLLGAPDKAIALLKPHQNRSETSIQHQLGINYYMKRDFSNAVPLLQKVVKANQPDKYFDAYFLLGTYYYKQGKIEAAEKPLVIYLQQKPNDVNARGVLGNIYLRKKRYKEAIEAFRAILKLRPRNLRVKINVGNIWYQQGQYNKAIDLYTAILAELKKTNRRAPFTVHFNLGMSYFQVKQWRKAEEQFDQFMAQNPRQGKQLAYYYLGNAQFELRKYGEAKKNLLKAAALSPNNPVTHYRLGVLAIAENRLDDALRYLRKAHSLKNDDPQILFEIGKIELKKGRLEDALSDFDKAIKLQPSNASFHSYRAWVFYQKKDYSRAAEGYDKALTLDPRRTNARKGLVACLNLIASALLKQEKLSAAASYLERVVKLDPKNKSALVNLGVILYEDKKYGQAATYLSRAYNLDKSNDSLLIAYAQTLVAQKKLDDAAEVLRDAAGRVQTNRDLYYNILGIVQGMQKKHDRAVDFLQKAKQASRNNQKINTNLAIALFNRGVNYLQQGDVRKAAADFLAALRNNPQMRRSEKGVMNFAAAFALVYSNQNFDRALKLFEKARASLSKQEIAAMFSADPNIYQAYCHYRLKHTSQLIALLKDHPSRKVKGSLVQKMLSYSYAKLAYTAYTKGSMDKAEQYLKQALEMNPKDKILVHNQAVIAYVRGQRDSAAGIFQKLGQTVKESILNLGFYLDDQKRDKRQAYLKYKQYVSLGGKDVELARRLMRVKEKIFAFQ